MLWGKLGSTVSEVSHHLIDAWLETKDRDFQASLNLSRYELVV